MASLQPAWYEDKALTHVCGLVVHEHSPLQLQMDTLSESVLRLFPAAPERGGRRPAVGIDKDASWHASTPATSWRTAAEYCSSTAIARLLLHCSSTAALAQL